MKKIQNRLAVTAAMAAFALIPFFQPLAQASSFDWTSLVGNYVSTQCFTAPGHDGQALPPQPMNAYVGLSFIISPANNGLIVATPNSNSGITELFPFAFTQIDRGPQDISSSNPGMELYSNGTSTAITLPNGVKATNATKISTPLGSDGGFQTIASLTRTDAGIEYKIVQVSPDPAVGPHVRFVEWHGCLLKKVGN